MDKTDYILRSLSKISHKRWEHYVINRIFHLVNDLDIEFVCQQCIRNEEDQIYLADLFFPQLNLYLEIDEGHHDSQSARIKDAKRRLDIADVTGFFEKRICASNVTIETLNNSIDDFIAFVLQRKAEQQAIGAFHAWNHEQQYTAIPHLDAGEIIVGSRAVFRHHRDALNCFGYQKGHHQQGAWNLPPEVCDEIGLSRNSMVWFPKLYEQADWDNSLSDDGKTIVERSKKLDKDYTEKRVQRIVMAHSKDELNRTLYRFLGVFEVIPEKNSKDERQFRRVSTRVKTYRAN